VIKKNLSLTQVVEATEILKSHGIGVHHYITVGFPDETWERVKRTIDFELRHRPDSMTVAMIVPYPGTSLANNGKIQVRDGVEYQDYIHEPMWTDRNQEVADIANLQPHICYTNVMSSLEIAQARYLMLKIWEHRDEPHRRKKYMGILNSKIVREAKPLSNRKG
jgi:radical SAM superfamily enzyme YgiQ (UPF0313 family)